MKKLVLFISGLAFCLQYSYAQYLFKSFDINPGPASSADDHYWGVNNNKLYFLAKTQAFGIEPFVCDGTTNGTFMLKDIWPGKGDSYAYNNLPQNPPCNGKMFYRASDSVHGYELWATDGTTAGTQLIKDIRPGIQTSTPVNIRPYKGKMYFNANDGSPANNFELWVSDGTTAGTYMFANLCNVPFIESSYPSNFREYNGLLYFQAVDPSINKIKVWSTDGTTANTNPTNITRLFRPDAAIEYNGYLYFCNNDTPAQGLYKTDGTAAGTLLIKSLSISHSGISMGNFLTYDNHFYFTAFDSTHGYEVWISDGTTAGTYMLKDINPGKPDGGITSGVVYNNKLYFAGTDTSNTKTGTEIWVTDGTTNGTHLFLDINPGNANSAAGYLTVFNNHLFFVANDGSGLNLFISDGTSGGTHKIQPPWTTKTNALYPAYGQGSGHSMIECNNSLYFFADFDSIGAELWSITDTSTTVITTYNYTPSFTIYPNPSVGTFTIQLENTNFQNGTVKVYDVMGKEIFKSQITNSKSQITLQQPKGIYLVKLQLDDVVLTKRVTVN